MSNTEVDTENPGILSVDPSLEPFKDHFRYRLKRYVDQKDLIDKHEGGLEEFAKGDAVITTKNIPRKPDSCNLSRAFFPFFSYMNKYSCC